MARLLRIIDNSQEIVGDPRFSMLKLCPEHCGPHHDGDTDELVFIDPVDPIVQQRQFLKALSTYYCEDGYSGGRYPAVDILKQPIDQRHRKRYIISHQKDRVMQDPERSAFWTLGASHYGKAEANWVYRYETGDIMKYKYLSASWLMSSFKAALAELQ